MMLGSRTYAPLSILLACALSGCNPSAASAGATSDSGKVVMATSGATSANPPPPASPAEAAPTPQPAVTKDVTFDDIKLDLKKGEPFDAKFLTDKVKALDGKAIRIRGYILPSFQQTGIQQFVLVRDNMECCFGPGALLHDCVLVKMVPPATADFTVRPVSAQGTFSIREFKGPDGKHLAIYFLEAVDVR